MIGARNLVQRQNTQSNEWGSGSVPEFAQQQNIKQMSEALGQVQSMEKGSKGGRADFELQNYTGYLLFPYFFFCN